jgi:hypothetical protein
MDDRPSLSRKEVGAMSTSEGRAPRAIEGQTERVELCDRGFEDCELISSEGPGVETLWLLLDGEDILVSKRQVTLAGAGAQGRPVR